MTLPDPDNQSREIPAPETDGALTPGIYLEEQKSVIGTGGTAKTTEFRNFWVTLTVTEACAEMVLLDDDFRPTGLRRTFGCETILGPGWHFIAEGEKRYQRLRPHLDRLLVSSAPKAAGTPPAKGQAANWWSGGAGGGPPQDPFALDKKKKTAPAPKKGGWWEK